MDHLYVYAEVWPVSTLVTGIAEGWIDKDLLFGKNYRTGLVDESDISHSRCSIAMDRIMLKLHSGEPREDCPDSLAFFLGWMQLLNLGVTLYSGVPCELVEGKYVAMESPDWGASALTNIYDRLQDPTWTTE